MGYKREGGFIITKIKHLAGRIFAKLLKKYNVREINPAQGRIIFTLWQKDGIPIHEIAEKTQLEKSTLTSMLDRLEKDGFIERVHSKEDRRKIIIKRTDKDKALEKNYLAVSEEINKYYYEGFTEKEINEFENYLRRILNNLIKYKDI
jgi:DNA-binding MarR family transcriptional regulator